MGTSLNLSLYHPDQSWTIPYLCSSLQCRNNRVAAAAAASPLHLQVISWSTRETLSEKNRKRKAEFLLHPGTSCPNEAPLFPRPICPQRDRRYRATRGPDSPGWVEGQFRGPSLGVPMIAIPGAPVITNAPLSGWWPPLHGTVSLAPVAAAC